MNDEGWVGDQVLGFQEPINRGFRDVIAVGGGDWNQPV
jgi:hypothetical protein